MNRLILEELKKVKVAKVPAFSDDTLIINIPRGVSEGNTKAKYIPSPSEFEVGKTYRVEVDKSLTDPASKWYETIHGNWNAGVGLIETNLDLQVTERIGKMVRVDAVGTNNPSYRWMGFLPQGNIKKIEELS